jgi:hypothetical protein
VAVRSIIDVQVNDDKFKRFAALFDRYRGNVDKAAKSMREINEEAGGIPGDVQAAAKFLENMKDSSEKVAAATGRASSLFSNIASSSKTIASSIKSATDSLLRWASISTIVGGLLGVGSLFGLDHLASVVGRGRRESEGVGTSYGEQRAFELTYGRFVDPGFLNRIGESSSDPTRNWVLRRLGASQGALAGGNSVDIARQILPALQQFAKNTPANQLGLLAKAFHYTDIISLEELKRLRAAQPGEFGQLGQEFGGRVARFSRNPQLEKAYQDFDNTLKDAGESIENAFVKGIAPLIPSFTDLSKVLSDIVLRFFKEIKPDDVSKLGTKIKEFADYLGSEDFKVKLTAFIDDIEKLGDIFVKLIEKIGGFVSPETAPAAVVGKRPMTFKESLQKPGGGGFWDYIGGTTVDTGEEVPLPRRRPKVFGDVQGPKPDTNPSIGGGANNMGENFDAYWNASTSKIRNQSSQEVTVTVQSPAGGSVPRAASQIGTAP